MKLLNELKQKLAFSQESDVSSVLPGQYNEEERINDLMELSAGLKVLSGRMFNESVDADLISCGINIKKACEHLDHYIYVNMNKIK